MVKVLLPTKARLLQLNEISCKIFNTTFNPNGIRTGSKILNKRLKGPVIANYYGNVNMPTLKNFKHLFPGESPLTKDEVYRLRILEARTRRGKNPPKKKRTAEKTKK